MSSGLGLGIFGVSPLLEQNLIWGFSAAGLLLSLCAWYTHARSEERTEAAKQKAARAESNADKSHRIIEAVPGMFASNSAQDTMRHAELMDNFRRLAVLYERRAVVSSAELEVPDAPQRIQSEQKVLDDAIGAQEERVLQQIAEITATAHATLPMLRGPDAPAPERPQDDS